MKSNLKRQNKNLTTLYNIALDLLNNRGLDDVLNTIILRASELLEAPIGFLDLLDGETLVIQATTEFVKSSRGERVPLSSAHLTQLAIQTRKPQFVKNYIKRTDRVKIHDPYRIMAACTFPIVINDKAVGALSLGRTKSNHFFTDEDEELMRSLAQLSAFAFENANLFEETKRKSVTDSLTGLANRRHFDVLMEQEWKHAMREKTPISLIMADIDSFKKYNDTYGHAMGDECLKQIASTLTKVGSRVSDLPARYGGEEFALVLLSTNLADARRIASEFCSCVRAMKIPHATSEVKPWVTVSVGVASITPAQEDEPLKLLKMADEAMYKAKHAGKNRMCFCRTAPPAARKIKAVTRKRKMTGGVALARIKSRPSGDA